MDRMERKWKFLWVLGIVIGVVIVVLIISVVAPQRYQIISVKLGGPFIFYILKRMIEIFPNIVLISLVCLAIYYLFKLVGAIPGDRLKTMRPERFFSSSVFKVIIIGFTLDFSTKIVALILFPDWVRLNFEPPFYKLGEEWSISHLRCDVIGIIRGLMFFFYFYFFSVALQSSKKVISIGSVSVGLMLVGFIAHFRLFPNPSPIIDFLPLPLDFKENKVMYTNLADMCLVFGGGGFIIFLCCFFINLIKKAFIPLRKDIEIRFGRILILFIIFFLLEEFMRVIH